MYRNYDNFNSVLLQYKKNFFLIKKKNTDVNNF